MKKKNYMSKPIYTLASVHVKFWDFKLVSTKTHSSPNIWKNKFEVSKIYMNACKCIYKFWHFSSWFFHVLFKNLSNIFMILYDFPCFSQDLECFIKFKKYIYMFFNDFDEFFKTFQDFSRIFKNFHEFSWFFSTFNFLPFYHD